MLLVASALSLHAVACSDDGGAPPQHQTDPKPTASAGQDHVASIGDTVTLDGSKSAPAKAGDKLTYAWSLVVPSGSKAVLSSASDVSPTFKADVGGAYVASLVVADGASKSDPAKITITVTAKENTKPTAKAKATPASPKVGDEIDLDGSESADPDGDALTYKWTLAKAPDASAAKLSDATAAKPKLTADKAGEYDLKLVVNDGKVDSNAAELKITVADAKPTAKVTASKTQITAGESVDLDATGSSDPDPHATLTYKWTIKTKPTTSALALTAEQEKASKVTVKLDVEGDYELSVIVKDAHAESDPATVKVSAKKP